MGGIGPEVVALDGAIVSLKQRLVAQSQRRRDPLEEH